MKPIAIEFDGRADQRGYHFKLMKREGDVALFEKINPSHKSGTKHYEVVIIKNVPERTFPNGKVTEAHEAMPSPEEWGSSGWSPYDYAAALTKFDEISRGNTPNYSEGQGVLGI